MKARDLAWFPKTDPAFADFADLSWDADWELVRKPLVHQECDFCNKATGPEGWVYVQWYRDGDQTDPADMGLYAIACDSCRKEEFEP